MHVDKNGFVYVNADKSPDAISWKQQFGDFENQDRFKRIDWENFDYALSWSMEDAPYNWKVLCVTLPLIRLIASADPRQRLSRSHCSHDGHHRKYYQLGQLQRVYVFSLRP